MPRSSLKVLSCVMRPKGVDGYLRTDDEIALLLGRYRNGPDGTRDNSRSVFRQIDVVVVLEAKSRAEPQLHGSELQIIRNLIDRLATRLGRRFTRQRRTNGVLSPEQSAPRREPE